MSWGGPWGFRRHHRFFGGFGGGCGFGGCGWGGGCGCGGWDGGCGWGGGWC